MMIHVPELCSQCHGTNAVDKGGLHFTSAVQMSCNSHCPFWETKVRCDEDIHGFACSAGEETPSHLSHMKFPVRFPRSQCACRVLYSVVVKGCYSHKVIKSYVPGTLNGLLTNCVHAKNYCSFASLWLSTHLCPLILCKRLSQDKQSQDVLSPAEKSQGDMLLMLHLYLPVLSLLKTFPVRDKLVKR